MHSDCFRTNRGTVPISGSPDEEMDDGDTRKQSQWNHFWHPSHCTISLPVYGAYISTTSSFKTLGFLAAMLYEGKGNTAPFWKHCSKCFRIKNWSNSSIQRSCPLHIAVAVAIAKRPQSLAPDCCCILMYSSTMESLLACGISAILYLSECESFRWCELSNTWTTSLEHPTVGTVIQ